jgi:methylated-DNA-[protein]-cysteine S-methyltransferase
MFLELEFEMKYLSFKSDIGEIFLLSNNKNELVSLDFNSRPKHYKNAVETFDDRFLTDVKAQVLEYLNGKRKTFKIKYALNGTEFQKLAWKTLSEIPFGKIISYKDEAIKMNCPKGFRAVGSANGKNPIPIIIPCHRVVTHDGRLGGYSSGLSLKLKLLSLEGHLLIDGKIA